MVRAKHSLTLKWAPASSCLKADMSWHWRRQSISKDHQTGCCCNLRNCVAMQDVQVTQDVPQSAKHLHQDLGGTIHGIGWPYTETCYSEKYDLYEIEKYCSQLTASIGGWSPGLLCDPPSIHSCKPIIQSFIAAQSIIHTILWSCTFSCICTLNHLGQHPSWQKS